MLARIGAALTQAAHWRALSLSCARFQCAAPTAFSWILNVSTFFSHEMKKKGKKRYFQLVQLPADWEVLSSHTARK